MPDYMFAHAGQWYAGHGTRCGALGVSSCLINLVLYDENQTYATVIDRMMWWYAGMKFPTDRFDDISAFPKQVQAQAMTPLCHTSVSKWTMAAGEEVTSKAKYERCAKVAGEVVYTVVRRRQAVVWHIACMRDCREEADATRQFVLRIDIAHLDDLDGALPGPSDAPAGFGISRKATASPALRLA